MIGILLAKIYEHLEWSMWNIYIYIFFEKSEDAIGVADGLLLM